MQPARDEASVGQTRIVLANCGVIDPESVDEAIAAGAYRALSQVMEEEIAPSAVIDEVIASGLRGRGGAGFPTGRKWSLVADVTEKYIVCNADEGEPGTYKDRLLLTGDPHRVIEGIILAGYAIGAKKGYVYIRGEYALSIRRMKTAIEQAREKGVLGEHVCGTGFSFDIEVRTGAGAYVCGEETALIESLEGKRGIPRIKPPYPGSVGAWSKPTVVNNVETLANIAPILLNKARWFRSFGTKSSPGTKVFLLLGGVESPGAVELEMGTTLREIIYRYGGGVRAARSFKGALIGGAAGAFVNGTTLDIPMEFDSLLAHGAVLGSGAILVLDDNISVISLLRGILRFFERESCGQCVPCRLGTTRLVEIIDRIAVRKARTGDVELLLDLARTMKKTSLCPLGQSPVLPIESALRCFEGEFAT